MIKKSRTFTTRDEATAFAGFLKVFHRHEECGFIEVSETWAGTWIVSWIESA